MKNNYLLYSTISILLSSLLFTGCGEVETDFQPHKIERVGAKANVDDNSSWHKKVSISSTYDKSDVKNHKLIFEVLFEKSMPTYVEHLQVYIDTDYNDSTGWSYGGGDAKTIGADYMIEDDKLFRSTSNTKWTWEYVDKLKIYKSKESDNKFRVKLVGDSSKIMSITDINNIQNMNISIEPVDINWQDTNNFITSQDIKLNIDDGVNETIYEDAENGLSANWTTRLGQYTPQRKTPGYLNQSKGFVKLTPDWVDKGNELWTNKSEYHLTMNNSEQKILSVDVVGDGLWMEHYVLGAIVTTQEGERRLQWDSFYNHENKKAEKQVYDNGTVFMIFPSPIELVRGHEISDPYINETFIVDLDLAIKQFEPNNTILSVDTFVATGGNLDNIKLLSK